MTTEQGEFDISSLRAPSADKGTYESASEVCSEKTQKSNGGCEKDVVSRRREGGPQPGHPPPPDVSRAPLWDVFQSGPAPQYWC